MITPEYSEAPYEIGDFYRPSGVLYGSRVNEAAINDRLRTLAYGLFPYERPVGAETSELYSVVDSLRTVLAKGNFKGRIGTNNFGVYLVQASDEIIVTSEAAYKPTQMTLYDITHSAFRLEGKATRVYAYDEYGELVKTPDSFCISDRPYAMGRILVTALDALTYVAAHGTDTTAVAESQ